VEFYKGGCVACLFIDPCMDQLADEYQDRVIFTKFELETFWHQITCPALWKRYRIGLFPTVLLFVGGKEKKRWAVNYGTDAYRTVLDEVVEGSPPGKS
jgi:thiol-disulfide isomerase/thioredoxin